jgi:hypothetical protein
MAHEYKWRDLYPEAWFHDGEDWRHRPWWKVAINKVLRALQPWPRKVVVYSRCIVPADGSRPRAIGFGIGPVLHRSS